MNRRNLISDAVSSVVLHVLAVAVAAGPLLPFDGAIYGAGLAMAILLGAWSWYGDHVFFGVIDTRHKRWPRAVFAVSALFLVALSYHAATRETGVETGVIADMTPRTVISLILLWYGATALFSTFFMGKEVAVFLHNPPAWVIRKLRS